MEPRALPEVAIGRGLELVPFCIEKRDETSSTAETLLEIKQQRKSIFQWTTSTFYNVGSVAENNLEVFVRGKFSTTLRPFSFHLKMFYRKIVQILKREYKGCPAKSRTRTENGTWGLSQEKRERCNAECRGESTMKKIVARRGKTK